VKRALVLCPGRGSYTKAQLGSLAGLDADTSAAELSTTLDAVDRRREAAGDLTVRGMDAAETFSSRFLQGLNAAPLIFAATAYERLQLDPARIEVVAVGGNSMGWYSALWAAGVLDLAAAFQLIETMGGSTRGGTIGGQLIYPAIDGDWRHDAVRSSAVDAALGAARTAGLQAGDSIRFGGFRVLWGEDASLELMTDELPACEFERTHYPIRLLGNSAFHSELMTDVARAGQAALQGLQLTTPRIPLIDGRGHQWRPLTTEPPELLDYTLGHQVTETFDFRQTVRVALREYAPDLVVALGPGESLGGAIAQVMIDERWQGIADRQQFLDRQRDDPVVISLARPEQAAHVVRSP
jgi:[acyl-carrier-protein] S-malonyltransferase